jgi:hypothetical protein
VRALGVTALLESVLTVVVSLLLGGALLGMAGRLPGDKLTGVAWTLLLAVAVSPPVLNRVLDRVTRWRGRTRHAPRLSWGDERALLLWMVPFWLLSAITFTLYLWAFGLDLPGPVTIAGTFRSPGPSGSSPRSHRRVPAPSRSCLWPLLGGDHGAAMAVVVAGFRALMGVRDALAFGWGVSAAPMDRHDDHCDCPRM